MTAWWVPFAVVAVWLAIALPFAYIVGRTGRLNERHLEDEDAGWSFPRHPVDELQARRDLYTVREADRRTENVVYVNAPARQTPPGADQRS